MIKIVMEIPESFREHWEKDRFGESICRLSGDAHLLAGNYEKELCAMLYVAFRRAIPAWEEEVIDGKKRL